MGLQLCGHSATFPFSSLLEPVTAGYADGSYNNADILNEADKNYFRKAAASKEGILFIYRRHFHVVSVQKKAYYFNFLHTLT
jgi:hypothetical protein